MSWNWLDEAFQREAAYMSRIPPDARDLHMVRVDGVWIPLLEFLSPTPSAVVGRTVYVGGCEHVVTSVVVNGPDHYSVDFIRVDEWERMHQR